MRFIFYFKKYIFKVHIKPSERPVLTNKLNIASHYRNFSLIYAEIHSKFPYIYINARAHRK